MSNTHCDGDMGNFRSPSYRAEGSNMMGLESGDTR